MSMAKKVKPKSRKAPATPNPASPKPPSEPIERVWMHLYDEWRDATGKPEERVRQDFILHLHNNYGYAFRELRAMRRQCRGIVE